MGTFIFITAGLSVPAHSNAAVQRCAQVEDRRWWEGEGKETHRNEREGGEVGGQVSGAGSSLNKHFSVFPLLKLFPTHMIFILIAGQESIIPFLGQADGAFVEEINYQAAQH